MQQADDKKYEQAFFIQLAQKGKEAWNAWREENPKIPVNFNSIDFTEEENTIESFSAFNFGDKASFANSKFGDAANFGGATFGHNIYFSGATFGDEVTFIGAKFGDRADFRESLFGDRANFFSSTFGVSASFSSSTFGDWADVRYSTFSDKAKFRNVTFGDGARFDSSKFGDRASFSGSTFGNRIDLAGTILDGADLRGVKKLQLDGTSIRHARFDTNAKDHWSVLRRTYTGPRLAFTLILLIAFVAPYAAKVAYWSAINRAQTYSIQSHEAIEAELQDKASEIGVPQPLVEQLVIDNVSRNQMNSCGKEICRTFTVWQLAIGVDRGLTTWLLAAALLAFNALKTIITVSVIPMREQEERSGFSPAINQSESLHHVLMTTSGLQELLPRVARYPWTVTWGNEFFYKLHRVVQMLLILSIVAFFYNAYIWLDQLVYLP